VERRTLRIEEVFGYLPEREGSGIREEEKTPPSDVRGGGVKLEEEKERHARKKLISDIMRICFFQVRKGRGKKRGRYKK